MVNLTTTQVETLFDELEYLGTQLQVLDNKVPPVISGSYGVERYDTLRGS